MNYSRRFFLVWHLKKRTSVNIESTSLPSSYTTQTCDVPSFVKDIHIQVSSYVAGFICRKLLQKDCQKCVEYMLSEQVTDSQAAIRFERLQGQVVLSVKSLIMQIDVAKVVIFKNFFNRINSDNIICAFDDVLEVNVPCSSHAVELCVKIKKVIVYVMVKHIVNLINKKIKVRGRRKNVLIDSYLNVHGPHKRKVKNLIL